MRGMILAAAAVAIGFSAGASKAKAQTNFSDPFFLYYGFFLPRQQALSNQPGPELGIMANQAARQSAILSDRANLYAPIRGIGEEELNSTSPYSGRTMGRTGIPKFAFNTNGHYTSVTTLAGRGVAGSHNRVDRYYPSLRTGGPTGGGGRRAIPSNGMGVGTGLGRGLAPGSGMGGGMGGMGGGMGGPG